MDQRSLEIGLEEQLSARSHEGFELVMGWCGLSHKRVEDGCKGTCVNFVG